MLLEVGLVARILGSEGRGATASESPPEKRLTLTTERILDEFRSEELVSTNIYLDKFFVKSHVYRYLEAFGS